MKSSLCVRGAAALGLLLLLTGQAGANPLKWTALTLANGWVRYDPTLRTPSAALDSGKTVHLKGAVYQSAGSSTGLFILPAAFRPSASVYVPVTLVIGKPGRLTILPNGSVSVQTASGNLVDAQQFLSLEGVTFSLN
jgi:hypothetical protein